jgi:hypothetical protein
VDSTACSGCALPRTGPSSTSSWPSGAIAPVTTLRNRNPSRDIPGWSAEAGMIHQKENHPAEHSGSAPATVPFKISPNPASVSIALTSY